MWIPVPLKVPTTWPFKGAWLVALGSTAGRTQCPTMSDGSQHVNSRTDQRRAGQGRFCLTGQIYGVVAS
jgi:hypothetical protein